MKRETFILKIVVFIVGIPIFIFCSIYLPILAYGLADYFPELSYLRYPLLITLSATSIPLIFAMYNALKLLTNIDKNKAFSDSSVIALRNIKRCAIIFSILYAVCMPGLFLLADRDDAPGLILIGLAIIFAAVISAVCINVLQKLLSNALDIKAENDLII